MKITLLGDLAPVDDLVFDFLQSYEQKSTLKEIAGNAVSTPVSKNGVHAIAQRKTDAGEGEILLRCLPAERWPGDAEEQTSCPLCPL
jgi:hypothetical protein